MVSLHETRRPGNDREIQSHTTHLQKQRRTIVILYVEADDFRQKAVETRRFDLFQCCIIGIAFERALFLFFSGFRIRTGLCGITNLFVGSTNHFG